VSFSRGVAAVLVAVSIAACGADAVEPAPATHDLMEPWQPVPFAVDRSIITTAESACRSLAPPPNVRLAAVDARGGGRLLLIFAGPRNEFECQVLVDSYGHATTDLGGTMESDDPIRPPEPGTLGNVIVTSGGAATEAVSWVVGQAGAGVAAVDIALSAHPSVRASLGPTGWFAAWWPGQEGYTSLTGLDATGKSIWTDQ
jgi:hypothetical protein